MPFFSGPAEQLIHVRAACSASGDWTSNTGNWPGCLAALADCLAGPETAACCHQLAKPHGVLRQVQANMKGPRAQSKLAANNIG